LSAIIVIKANSATAFEFVRDTNWNSGFISRVIYRIKPIPWLDEFNESPEQSWL
jgi:hypothetical protein